MDFYQINVAVKILETIPHIWMTVNSSVMLTLWRRFIRLEWKIEIMKYFIVMIPDPITIQNCLNNARC